MRTLIALPFAFVATVAFASEPTTGRPNHGSFHEGGFDVINRQNLNVQFRIPIVSSPGRGLDLEHALVHDSLVWQKSGYPETWTPVADGSGAPLWGWKQHAVTGSFKFKVNIDETEICIVGDPEAESIHYFDYVYTDPSGTTRFFDIDFVRNCQGQYVGTQTGFATDGSGYFLDAATDPTHPVVWTPGGIKIEDTGKVTDTNGNYVSKVVVSSTETHWKDTLGRITLKVKKNPNDIEYWYLDNVGGYQRIAVNFSLEGFDIQTNFVCGVQEHTSYNVKLPVSITLPNLQSYSFTYEPTPGYSGFTTGRIKRVTLPTGGYYEYDYPGSNNGINCSDASAKSLTRVVNDGTTSRTWTFTRTDQGGGAWKTKMVAPQLPYDAAANEVVSTFNSAGHETSLKIYQGAEAGTPLRETTTTYAGGHPDIVQVKLDGGKVSQRDFDFDSYGNVTRIIEYNYGANSPGTAFRTTELTYLTSSGYTSRKIYDRLSRKVIRAGGTSGTISFFQDIGYDDTSLTCVLGASQRDSGYGCTFTARGNPTRLTTYKVPATPSGPVVKTFFYDSVGNVRKATADCCQQKEWLYTQTTQWAYPEEEVSGPPGGPQLETNATYYWNTGQLASWTDENLKVTNYAYDVFKRPTSITRPDNQQLTWEYDDVNRASTMSIPIQGSDRRRRVEYYDPLGRPFKTQLTDISGGTIYSITNTEFDAVGRAYRRSNPHTSTPQYWTDTRFDALGRTTKVIPPDGTGTSNNTTSVYAGPTVTVTDQAGKQRRSEYDAAGRLVKVTEPDVVSLQLDKETSYAYNVLDQLTTSNQGVQTRTSVYDGLGRMTSQTTPEAGTVTYQYNEFNQVEYRTDARGVDTDYTYDGLNRLERVDYDVSGTTALTTASVVYTYGNQPSQNENGRLKSMSDGVGTEALSYNVLGRITQVRKTIAGTNYDVGYSYNHAGDITTLTYPGGRTVSHEYDSVGELERIYGAGGNYISGMSHNPAGKVTGFQYGNGISASWSYSAERNQLTGIQHGNAFQLSYAYAHPNGGNNGQITGVTDSLVAGRTITLGYDALRRLSTASTTGSTPPAWGLTWTYDRYGNITAQAKTAGSPPELLPPPHPSPYSVDPATNRVSPSGYAYDSSGNMLAMPAGGTMQYDAENRIVDHSIGGSSSSYSFDGHGMRVRKVRGGTTTLFVYSGTRPIAEYTNGTLAREYVHHDGRLLATHNGATLEYHHRDHLSIRVTTNSSGAVIREQGHYPFGEIWYPLVQPTSWLFTTYQSDIEEGTDYAVARSRRTSLGRFLQVDPWPGSISDPQSLNRYSYTGNDPVNRVDPLGLCFQPPCPGQGGEWFDVDDIDDGLSVLMRPPQGPGSRGSGRGPWSSDPDDQDDDSEDFDFEEWLEAHHPGFQILKALLAMLEAYDSQHDERTINGLQGHFQGNCEAAAYGPWGVGTAIVIGVGNEVNSLYQNGVSKQELENSLLDMNSNTWGIVAGLSGQDCRPWEGGER